MIPESDIDSPDGSGGCTSQVSMEGPEYCGCMDVLSFDARANSLEAHVTVCGGRLMTRKDSWAESPPAELFAQIVW